MTCAVTDGHAVLPAGVSAAVAAGARLVDLGSVSADVVASVRASQPGIFVWASGQGAAAADLTSDAAIAASTGAALVCHGRDAALESGISRDSILVAAEPAQVPALAAEGWAVLVNADTGDGEPGAVAIAAVSAWAGARVVRTRNVAAVRQGIDMVESIRGTRPPARATRGLA